MVNALSYDIIALLQFITARHEKSVAIHPLLLNKCMCLNIGRIQCELFVNKQKLARLKCPLDEILMIETSDLFP